MAKIVSRIFEQKGAIGLVLSADRNARNIVPTWQDLDVLQAIDSAISPVSTLTDILSGEVLDYFSCPSSVTHTLNRLA